MDATLRNGFYAGLLLAVALGIFLFQLWRPARQVELHSGNLIRAIERQDWKDLAGFIADNYEDQWGQDRALLLERVRGVVGYARELHLQPWEAVVRGAETEEPFWRARLTVEGADNEVVLLIKQHVNVVADPWELHWRKQSWKPWDWKLVRVRNPGFKLPQGGLF
ncbi:hypothetical protein BH20VER1_BH20VER1_12630 [soil metagenome]